MCVLCEINQAKSEKFGNRLLEIYNDAALAIMVSIGHRTGLFDTLAALPPASSEEIAGNAGLNERYVREWLHTMVVGRILEADEQGTHYYLPKEHSMFLTRANPADNMAVFAQYIPELAMVEDKIILCFKNGGGVPYEAFHRFHEIMAEDSGQTVLSVLIPTILPLVPDLVEDLEEGIAVLDIGCGSGRALNLMAENFPNSNFTGYDLCLEPIEAANREALSRGLTNVQFEQLDLTSADPEARFDLITAFDAIHDQARPDKVLSFVWHSLKPKGTFLMQDIDASEKVLNNMEHPLGPLLYTISTMHCMTVSLAQGGMGLGTMWGTERAQRMLRTAGFSQITENRLDHDPQNCYFVANK